MAAANFGLFALACAALIAIVGIATGDGVLMVIAVTFLLCAAALGLVARRGWLRAGARLRFILQGEAVRGEIVGRRASSQTVGTGIDMPRQITEYALFYSFSTKAGDVHEGRVGKVPSAVGKPYEKGDHVTAVYDPQNPARSDLDFFGERGWLGS